MKETTLELTVTIKADEPTLRDIQSLLVGRTKSETPPLTDALADITRQTIIAAGISGQFDVELEHGPIATHFKRGGGLNVDEWLKHDMSSQPDQPQEHED